MRWTTQSHFTVEDQKNGKDTRGVIGGRPGSHMDPQRGQLEPPGSSRAPTAGPGAPAGCTGTCSGSRRLAASGALRSSDGALGDAGEFLGPLTTGAVEKERKTRISGLSGSGFPIITVRAAQLCQSASSFSSIKSIQGRRGDQDRAMKKFVATSKGLWTEQGWATWSFEDLQSLLGPFWRYVLFFCPSSTNLTVNFLVRSFCHEFRVVVVRMDVVDPSCSEMMVLMMNHEKNRSPDSTGEQWGKVLRNW